MEVMEKQKEKEKTNQKERRKGEGYDVCEFWRIYQSEKSKEADNLKENGRYAWCVRTVFDGCGKG